MSYRDLVIAYLVNDFGSPIEEVEYYLSLPDWEEYFSFLLNDYDIAE